MRPSSGRARYAQVWGAPLAVLPAPGSSARIAGAHRARVPPISLATRRPSGVHHARSSPSPVVQYSGVAVPAGCVAPLVLRRDLSLAPATMGTPAFSPLVPAAAGQLVCRPAGMATAAAAAAAATTPSGRRLAQTPRGRRAAAVRAAPARMKAGHGAEVAASTASTASAAAAAADGDVGAVGIRTVALAGKDGCGKTALASALLALAASKRNAKGVDGGAPEEAAHGMTLYNHVYCAQVDDHRGTLWGGCRCWCGTRPLIAAPC